MLYTVKNFRANLFGREGNQFVRMLVDCHDMNMTLDNLISVYPWIADITGVDLAKLEAVLLLQIKNIINILKPDYIDIDYSILLNTNISYIIDDAIILIDKSNNVYNAIY